MILMIKLENVTKTYKMSKDNNVYALNNVSLNLPNKGLVFITGVSGSGKSTLLNVLGLLDKPNSGDIYIEGKNTKSFKTKQIDYYRNTYVGFIFQEYNLLSNLNVSKNVELALNLQHKKKAKVEVKEVLERVGLNGLEKRKINELSGGQKQRVAIARAIIKNPHIILADEPTGNLDTENSKQIFSLLKEISKERLVVVVTHDLTSANLYADRIIEMKDGLVSSDNGENTIEAETPLSFIKSRLSIFKALSLSFSTLRKKKIKLAVMILLLTVSFSLFGFSYLLTKFDINKTHAKTLIEQQESRIEITKKIKGKNYTTSSPAITFTKEELQNIDSKLKKETIKVSKAVENNWYLEFARANLNEDDKAYAYYEPYPTTLLFLEYSDKELNNLKLIGKVPTVPHEIIITKSLADYILKDGLTIKELDKKGNLVETTYLPKTYDEIVTSNKKIAFGSTYLIISAIVDEDLSKYDSLKTTLVDEMLINPTKLYEEYKAKYTSKINEIVVPTNFYENLNLTPNNVLPIDFYKLVYLNEDKRIHSNSLLALLNKKIKIYNGTSYQDIENLNGNEIIITETLLDELSNGEYSKELKNEIQTLQANYKKQVEEYENKLKELQKYQEENPEAEVTYPQAVIEPDLTKFIKEFAEKYISKNNIIGKTISLEVNDLYLRTQQEKTKVYKDYKIVGYTADDINNYVSKDSVFKNYMRDNAEVISLYFDEDNEQELVRIFKEFPGKNSSFTAKTVYTNTINTVTKVVNKVSVIAKYASLVALVFSIILFIYFSLTSINSNKKDIGILRALGARTIDIYKIFYLESFIVGIFSLVLSSITCYAGTILANNLISKDLFVNIKPIIFNYDIIIILFVTLIVLTMISFIIPVLKISKTKPIDVINNR